MNIVIVGPKGAGKSAVGALLADLLDIRLIETDQQIEKVHAAETGNALTCREIYQAQGNAAFRNWEKKAVASLADEDWSLIVTGGSTLLEPESRRVLRQDAMLIYLTGKPDALFPRATRNGVPPWLAGEDAATIFAADIQRKDEILSPYAEAIIDTSEQDAASVAAECVEHINAELVIRSRRASTFGEIIRATNFGESHGKGIGVVLEGIKPGFEISAEIIQKQLDRRRPGQSSITTPRQESDTVQILSGIFEGKTTGAPIALVIYNKDQDSARYDYLKEVFRPGHADFTFYKKYGLRDHRGGGRSSGRETATRVAAGAVALEILAKRGVTITAHTVAVGAVEAQTCDYSVIEKNIVRTADPLAAEKMIALIHAAKEDHDSVGGIVQLDIDGVPAGLGDPVFGKLDARLTGAVMSVGAIKGVEIGCGFAATRLRGSESNDAMSESGFMSNRAGGITGGISTGEKISLRAAVKPTSSIAKTQKTIDQTGKTLDLEVLGRHDPCIVPRAVPVLESMAALVILDAWEIQARLRPEWHTETTHPEEVEAN